MQNRRCVIIDVHELNEICLFFFKLLNCKQLFSTKFIVAVDGFRLCYNTLKRVAQLNLMYQNHMWKRLLTMLKKNMLPLQFHLRWFYWFTFISKFFFFGFCQQVVLFIFLFRLLFKVIGSMGFDRYNKTLIGVFDLTMSKIRRFKVFCSIYLEWVQQKSFCLK